MAGGAQNPHVICGDFNSPPGTPGHQLTSEGYLNDDTMAKLQAQDNVPMGEGKVREATYKLKKFSLIVLAHTVIRQTPHFRRGTNIRFGDFVIHRHKEVSYIYQDTRCLLLF